MKTKLYCRTKPGSLPYPEAQATESVDAEAAISVAVTEFLVGSIIINLLKPGKVRCVNALCDGYTEGRLKGYR